jgi:hypothetical protein
VNVPIIGKLLDERFLEHRRRSTSIAGVVTAELALLLFAYRYFVHHVWSWDLFAVAVTFVGVKLAVMTWHYLKN